jgi:hypothetical protein
MSTPRLKFKDLPRDYESLCRILLPRPVRSRLIGGSRNLGSMILRGDRNLTLDHIRTLSERFNVGAALFIN